MMLMVAHPWLLLALISALLPWFNSGIVNKTIPSLAIIPADRSSRLFDLLLKMVGCLAFIALVLGAAGLYRGEQRIERIGRGADMVLLLDRSNSMDNSFAGRAPSGALEAKSTVAKRLLTEFIDRREQDRIGIATFSTMAQFVLPLTRNKAALTAAIAATDTQALAYTHVAKGLALALSYFEHLDYRGQRVLVLVSDGAAVIDAEVQQQLRTAFKQLGVRLYWLYLRGEGSPGFDTAPDDPRLDTPQSMPERYLNKFFNSLDTHYRAYEVTSPEAMGNAMADIDALENQPLRYWQTVAREDWSGVCYACAELLLSLLVSARLLEVPR